MVKSSSLVLQKPQGLYRPEYEHDSCGVAFIVDIYGRKSNDIIKKAISALINLEHRGAKGAEKNTGDGNGILIQIPDKLFRETVNFELPPAGSYATGIAFLPQARQLALDAINAVEQIVTENGLIVLGWRDIITDDSSLGAIARDTMPEFKQIFIAAKDETGAYLSDLDLERKVWLVRKICEHELGNKGPGGGTIGAETVYFPSLSSRIFVYKGMLTEEQLPEFYADLRDSRLESALAIVHSRFSTNTLPAWPLAHPYRMVAHNGEINTVRGNENWMHAREALMQSKVIPDLSKAFPICTKGGSDTSLLDEALELLTLTGRSLPHAMLMLVPEAWEHNQKIDPKLRDFFDYHAALMEPWDGPAAIAFTDGTLIGATLDRNGLRPSRVWITEDGLVVMAAEFGVLDIPAEKIIAKDRLKPGRMFLVDTKAGRIISDKEIKASLAAAHPYGDWIKENSVRLEQLPEVKADHMPPSRITLRQQVFGYTTEDIKLIINPMATTGAEAIGSMGSDTPIAVLSKRPKLLFDYFSQKFAQVTNPPLDAIREELVTSMEIKLGPEANILAPDENSCKQIRLSTPIITNDQLATIKAAGDLENFQHLRSKTIYGLYNVAQGGAGMRNALGKIFKEVAAAIASGYGIIILSDRESNERYAPIPSLLLTAAVHNYLIKEKLRTKVGLIVETGDAREVHHFATLFGVGAGAINPYLAFETIEELAELGDLANLTGVDGVKNYIKAATKGVLKVMSKMGISTLSSYAGAGLFDVVGISQAVLDEYFFGAIAPIAGIGLEEIATAVASRHRYAFSPRPEELAHRSLTIGGEYQWRREGEYHLFNPDTVFKLQQATRTGNYEIFQQYSKLVDEQAEQLATIRGAFEFKSDRSPIPLSEVEPVAEIVKRFSTGAMSFGSISVEAHETLAIAMNRLKGRSNSGEGGEDPARFIPDNNGDWRRSAIKQVASGRFGVTANYLANCTDIQIKMAQGAKPGEGGQLPPNKVYPWVAEVRGSVPWIGLISPPPHHDIYSIEDLAQLIHDLKNANPQARIHVKLVAELGVGTVAAGVSKAHADVVLISGHDGGTGAAPLTSLKHAGGAWELGLAETQQTLLMNGLRDRIVVQVDGQLKTGRDVMVAAILGAEEYGFATAPLVVSGCVMMRVCHLDTCPVGVATQNPELRSRFTGKPEYVVNFFEFIAQEIRQYLADLGYRSLQEIIGKVDLLSLKPGISQREKINHLDLTPILAKINSPFMYQDTYCTKNQDHELELDLDEQLIKDTRAAITEDKSLELNYQIKNVNRSVGTRLSYEITKLKGIKGLTNSTIALNFTGSAGNSFGAFVTKGLKLTIFGDANDYIGKGLSGGEIIIRPAIKTHKDFIAETNVIAGNVIGYGASAGRIYVRGIVGERFCVRNSGVIAVVEGVGDHACEYMTQGKVIILGETGRNIGAGMSGGIAFFYDPQRITVNKLSQEITDAVCNLTEADIEWLHQEITRYAAATDSTRALEILARWPQVVEDFIKIMPKQYQQVMSVIEKARLDGVDVAAALMEVAGG